MKKICMNVSVAEPFLPTAVQITRKYPCQAKKMIKVPVQFVVDLLPWIFLTRVSWFQFMQKLYPLFWIYMLALEEPYIVTLYFVLDYFQLHTHRCANMFLGTGARDRNRKLDYCARLLNSSPRVWQSDAAQLQCLPSRKLQRSIVHWLPK